MGQITALPNAKAALIRKLVREKKTRDDEGVFVLEGEKPIRELLHEPAGNIRTVVMTPRFLQRAGQDFLKAVTQLPASAYLCQEPLFTRLSDVKTSQGLLAVIEKPRWDQAAIFARRPLFGLYGERLQDPTNVGSLIRSALALGVDAVWLSSDSADPFSPKVARATVGTVLKLPIFAATDAAVFTRQRCAVLAAEPAGRKSRDLRTIHTLPPRVVVALGNESQGLSQGTLESAALRFHITIDPNVESLNVAAAAAICLFHFAGLPRGNK
jgi:TrmH family RNA methyltransferase